MKRLVILALACLALQARAQSLTDSLIICMPMNSTANDYSGNLNNGTAISITPVADRFGNAGQAYEFNGTSGYINVPTSSSIDRIEASDELTITAWASVQSFPPSSNLFTIVEKFDLTGDHGWGFHIVNPNVFGGVNMFFVNHASTWNTYTANSPTLVLAPNTSPNWNHYAMTFSKSSGTFKYYVNGALISTTSISPSANQLITTADDLRIGFSQAGPDEYAHGLMDDLRVYNRELSISEITQLMNDTTVGCSASTPPPTGCCLGNNCGSAVNSLTTNYQVPLNSYNFNFTDSRIAHSQVLIGYQACGTSQSRLDVTDDFHGTGIKAYSSTSGKNNIGIHGMAADPNTVSSSFTTIGVLGEMNKIQKGRTVGVAGFCGPVSLTAIPASSPIGVYGNSVTNGGTWAGYFHGDLMITGNGWVNGAIAISSDRRFKTNITELGSVTEKLKALKSYTYNYRADEFKDKNFSSAEQIGLMAQELKEVFPQLVLEDKEGFYGVNYTGFIPVLLQAAKEQQVVIEQQQQQIEELKALVHTAITGAPATAKQDKNSSVVLSDKNAIVLNQNVPNPFAESTVITYQVPAESGKAQIIFSTSDGHVLKTMNIEAKGKGSLTVFADDLTTGVYSYTLVVDGKTIDTKKMIKK